MTRNSEKVTFTCPFCNSHPIEVEGVWHAGVLGDVRYGTAPEPSYFEITDHTESLAICTEAQTALDGGTGNSAIQDHAETALFDKHGPQDELNGGWEYKCPWCDKDVHTCNCTDSDDFQSLLTPGSL